MSQLRPNAGDLDRWIDLLRIGAGADDGYTSARGEPELLARVKAKVRPAPGSERLASAQNTADAPRIFTIRWSRALDPDAPGGLNPRDVLRYPAGADGRNWDIKSVTPLGRRGAIEILAIARTDQ